MKVGVVTIQLSIFERSISQFMRCFPKLVKLRVCLMGWILKEFSPNADRATLCRLRRHSAPKSASELKLLKNPKPNPSPKNPKYQLN